MGAGDGRCRLGRRHTMDGSDQSCRRWRWRWRRPDARRCLNIDRYPPCKVDSLRIESTEMAHVRAHEIGSIFYYFLDMGRREVGKDEYLLLPSPTIPPREGLGWRWGGGGAANKTKRKKSLSCACALVCGRSHYSNVHYRTKKQQHGFRFCIMIIFVALDQTTIYTFVAIDQTAIDFCIIIHVTLDLGIF